MQPTAPTPPTASEPEAEGGAARRETGRWSVVDAAPEAGVPQTALSRRRVMRMALTALGMLFAGCATAPAAGDSDEAHRFRVAITGLDFLRLDMDRGSALAAMRAHGYRCVDEAATDRLVPCTRAGSGAAAVVMSFSFDELKIVRTPVAAAGGSRQRFDRLVLDHRERFGAAAVEESDEMIVARFHPRDGTTIAIWHSRSADALGVLHLAAPPPQPSLGPAMAQR